MEGAEHDSGARDPPPRCQEDTRRTLKGKVNSWFEDEKRKEKFLWLNGPAGVGKSAIMQTATEAIADSNRLAAAIFFSRPNGRGDADKVIPTLAYQLALNIPGYRSYLIEQITLDPRILTKNLRELFRRFFVEPFVNRNIYHTGPTRCIFLDGLDECGTKNAQLTIIELIAEFVLEYPALPLIWIVASRPEEYLKRRFSAPRVAASHWQLYVPLDDDEARQDVERFLRSGFDEVKRKYPDATSPDWPLKKDFSKVTERASGLFVFASTVKRFLEDPDIADPVSQLEVVISVIDKISTPFLENPFATLDALYIQIAASIPPPVRLTVNLLVGHLLLRKDPLQVVGSVPNFPYTLVLVSNILGLRKNEVYGALDKLHSVLFIPSQDEAHKKHISVLHSSFSDFLRDEKRAREFVLDLTATNTQLWKRYHDIRLLANHDPSELALSPNVICD